MSLFSGSTLGRWCGFALAGVAFAGCATSGGLDDYFARQAARNSETLKTALPACEQGDLKACADACLADGPQTTCAKGCDGDFARSCDKLGTSDPDAGSDKGKTVGYFEKACTLGYPSSCSQGGSILTHANQLHPALDGPRGFALYRRGCDIDPNPADTMGISADAWFTFTRNACASAAEYAKTHGDPNLGRVLLARACLNVSPAVCGIYESQVGFKRDQDAAETAARIAAQRLEEKTNPPPSRSSSSSGGTSESRAAPAEKPVKTRSPICQSYSATYAQQKSANCY